MQPLNMPPSQLPQEQARRMHFNRPSTEEFGYTITFSTLTFGTTQTESLQIQSDSDFLLCQTSVSAQTTALLGSSLNYVEGERFAGIVCQIADGATQVPLSNEFVPISSLFGTGKQPRVLPQKRLIQRNSVLIFTLANLYTSSDGTMDSVIITLQGEKIYRGFTA